jgi:AraC-like DNA-binding protein
MIPEGFAHLLYEYLDSRGIDPEQLLQMPRPRTSPDNPGSFPIDQWIALLDRAATYLKDPTLGLKLGQNIAARHVGVLGYLLLASRNLAEALQRLDRYQRLVYDVTPMAYQPGAGYVDLVWGAQHGRPGPLVDETSISSLVQWCRNITGKNLVPHFVHFINPAPEDLQPYKDYFGCTVKFDCPETIVRIDAAALDYPLRNADPGLIEVMERHAKSLFARLPWEDSLIEQTRQAIADCLHEGEPSVDVIAAKLGRTVRTFQRDLGTAGSSFRDVLNTLRKEMALTYLEQAHLSILDIAMLLGYTEQSAFSRSFRQWTGNSPSEYRRLTLREH